MNEWTCMFSSCEIKLEYSNLFAIQPSPRLLSAELAHTQSCPGARGGERHVAGRPIRKKNPTAQPGPGQGFAPDRAADRVVTRSAARSGANPCPGPGWAVGFFFRIGRPA